MQKIYLAMLLKLAKKLYKSVLREELKKAIDDPDSEWDEVMMKVADSILK